MNYEERYNQALKVIESLYNVVRYQSSTDALFASQTIEKAFPELKESEDERIRKELISAFTVTADKREHEIYGHGITYGQVLAWLEKQGEQKPTWSEEDEKIRTLLIDILKVNHPNDIFKVNPIGTVGMEAMSTEELVNWLKSIKPNHWKPNEELLKDLPKWKKGTPPSAHMLYVTRKGYYMTIEELDELFEKLPKEE